MKDGETKNDRCKFLFTAPLLIDQFGLKTHRNWPKRFDCVCALALAARLIQNFAHVRCVSKVYKYISSSLAIFHLPPQNIVFYYS